MRPLDRVDLFAGFEGKKVYFGCFSPFLPPFYFPDLSD